MDWVRIGLTVLVAVIGTSLTDWFFMGFLFHDKYLETPELWRRQGGGGETKAIVWSTLLGAGSCAVFVSLCVCLNLRSYTEALGLGGALWLAGPLPIILTNALWMKYHPLLVLTHSAGWLARFVVTALAVGWLLG